MTANRTRRARRAASPALGSPPGTIVSSPDATPPLIRVIAYGPDTVEEREIKNVEDLREFQDRFAVLWVNVDGLGDPDVIRRLGERFGLHPLALEDVAHVSQRAKVEQYGDILFLVCRMVSTGQFVDSEQISMFLGKGFVVTFQERPGDCFDPVRERIRKSKGRIRQAGADYLVYSLLDAVIDNYFPVLEEYGDRIETLEQETSEAPGQGVLMKIRDLKRDLQVIRHAIWPLRDAVGLFFRERFPQITDDTMPYIRDCHDHAVRIIELLETYREQSSDLVNLYMSSISNRMNEIMRVLTIIATIFIPLTFIAGIYGMNFNPEISSLNMPELNWSWGYPFALGLMAVCAAGLLFFFRRKHWL
jgi:magnesium transporter